MIRLTSALALICAAPATAQTATPAPAQAVDPARVTAARSLLDALMPPATREQMIEGMIMPVLANIQSGMAQNPQFAQAIGSDLRVKTIFDEFMRKQMARSTQTMRASLPGMIDAIAKAYARRFDVAQLGELRRFFETPTGRAYARDSMTIMSDPDVAQWQQQMMARSMADVQADAAELTRQIAALQPPPTQK